jgi:hypothetical protein
VAQLRATLGNQNQSAQRVGSDDFVALDISFQAPGGFGTTAHLRKLLERGKVPVRIKITSGGITEVGVDQRAQPVSM